VCRLLLNRGAEVNRIGGGYKETALHRAARHGRLSVLQLLVGRGANVRLRDTHGETAADTARKWRQTDVADWLDSVSRVKEPLAVCSTVVTKRTEHSTGMQPDHIV
jgi:ankyrin repeat protein